MKSEAGQFFILGFRGLEIPSWLREFELRFGLGGVILFDYNCQTRTYQNNVASPEQIRALCGEIFALPSHPLVFVDQEGGKVRRLKEKFGFAPLPSAFAFNLLEKAERWRLADVSFRELKALGIHFNLAPVIDLNYNPANPDIGAVERSYSAEPSEVRENFQIVNEAAQAAGLGLSLKHFPGLGGARVNSHEELTDISDSISEEQLRLFYELGSRVSGQSILVSHGIVRQWDAERPVSMSAVGIQKLRAEIPEALLISDDLQMQGLQKMFPTGTASLIGLQAGIDLLCVGNNLLPEDEAALGWAEGVDQEMRASPSFAELTGRALNRIFAAKRKFQSH